MATDKELLAVWSKGHIMSKNVAHYMRTDDHGNTMYFNDYGTRDSHGWVIEYIKPLSEGGSDTLDNKRPMHWNAAHLRSLATNKELRAVWNKGRLFASFGPQSVREDILGNLMRYDEYGTQELHAWVIDYIKPLSEGGKDTLSNKRALSLKSRKILAEAPDILEVWKKGREFLKSTRLDVLGNFMNFDEFNTQNSHGWVIDYIKPLSKGGTDTLDNKRPLNWQSSKLLTKHSEILEVWEKGHTVKGYDPKILRLDDLGNIILFDDMGSEYRYGWTVDHIKPLSEGGSDTLDNKRPLRWNAKKEEGNG